MGKTRRLLFICFAALCLSAAPTRADLWLDIDIEKTWLDYTLAGQHADIGVTAGSSAVVVNLFDGGALQDSTEINMLYGGSFDAGMSLDFVKIGSKWTATGDLWVTDKNLTNTIEADFTSSLIEMEASAGSGVYELTIEGSLGPNLAATAILTGTDPWTFQGQVQDLTGASAALLPHGLDGVQNQVTVDSWEGWDGGTAVIFHYTVSASTLDDFFAADGTGYQGDVDINLVPVPGAVLLGMLGLSVAGIKLRKFA